VSAGHDRRALVLDYHGLAVRLAARRPKDRVLVQYLQPRTNYPMPSWAEVYAHQLKAPGITMPHLKSLIVVLPLARFAGDDDGPTIEAEAVSVPAIPRLPYVD
jgi:hypothetical protein